METFSALLAMCAGNSPVTGEFPAQRPVTRSFDVFFDLRMNERLSRPKHSWGWWLEAASRPLRRQSIGWLTAFTDKPYAPLPQRPAAGRKLVEKWIFHFRPISSDIGRTHFNLSRKYSAGTLLAGVWSEQPVGNPIVTIHWWDTSRTFSSGLHRSSSE